MKRETKEKIKGKVLRVTSAVAEFIPAIAVGSGIGMLIGGYWGALANAKAIKNLNSRTNKLEDDIDRIDRWANEEVVPKHNSFADWTHKEVNRLSEENRALMARALKETEGKA